MIGQIIFRNELSKGRQYDRRVREDLRLPCGRHTEHGLPHHGQSESWGAGKGGESALQMDASELSFDADPLFHVMSRRFDEGGARGLLLSNLVM